MTGAPVPAVAAEAVLEQDPDDPTVVLGYD